MSLISDQRIDISAYPSEKGASGVRSSGRLAREIIAFLSTFGAAIGAYARDSLPASLCPNPSGWSNSELTIANLGHATLMMNFFGVQVISDPSLYNRVGLTLDSRFTIGPRRLIAPPLAPDQVKPLDLILITHAHMDHLDLRSLRALPKTAAVVACHGCGALIRPLGFKDVRELRWGERTEVNGLSVTALGARHWGKRWPYGREYGLNSYILAKNGRRMLLACDSAFTNLFAAVADDPPDVAAFSIGAYDPWIWHHAHPEQVWRMFLETKARYLIPIHWGTFRLSKEPTDEPLKRLTADAGADSSRIVLRQIGGTWTLPDVEFHQSTPPAAN